MEKTIINKMLQKSLILLLMCLMLFSTGFVANNSYAKELQITRENLYAKEELVCIVYDGIKIGSDFVVYKKDGKEYPAYCVNRELPGVEVGYSYDVEINDLYTNNLVWNAIVNGYPFKTPAELGCNTEMEAFAATKLAVQDMLYNFDLSKFNICDDCGQTVLDAMMKIREKARNSKESKISAIINIKEDTNSWKVDDINNEYLSKTYSVETSATCEEYNIEVLENKIAKVVDIENKEKNTFKPDEKFKVILPIKELKEAGELTLSVNSSLKTYPIFYGESTVEGMQNYAVTAGEFEFTSGTLKQKYSKNITEIEIKKVDGDENIPLSNSKFNLLDSEKKVIFTELKTDENGIIKIQNLIPGTYFVKEVEAPQGYVKYEEAIEVKAELNEKVNVVVNNYKEPEIEEKKVEKTTELQVGEKKIEKEPIVKEPIVKENIKVKVEETAVTPVVAVEQEIIEKNIEKTIERKLPRTGF